MKIEINLSLRQLKLYDHRTVYGLYPVAIGKPSTPTPEGRYSITRKIINPGGILGTRWLELSIPSNDGPYGIHGTTQPWSIGKAVSNGCIRMYNHDVEEVFRYVSIGTPVFIAKSNTGAPKLTGNYYIVQPGDTLWNIARRFNISLDKLLAINNLDNPNRIYPGQKLVLG